MSRRESMNKETDKIEEYDIKNEIDLIIVYLEELEDYQDDHLDIAKKYEDHDYWQVDAMVSNSRSIINRINKILKNITNFIALKNLSNKSINSKNVTINYYCQDPTQYPTPNIQSGSNVEIIYHDKEYTE